MFKFDRTSVAFVMLAAGLVLMGLMLLDTRAQVRDLKETGADSAASAKRARDAASRVQSRLESNLFNLQWDADRAELQRTLERNSDFLGN